MIKQNNKQFLKFYIGDEMIAAISVSNEKREYGPLDDRYYLGDKYDHLHSRMLTITDV